MTYTQLRVDAAVKVAVGLGIQCGDPVVLADGANVVVHLSPAPVVAKVAASTTEVRPAATWLQRELDMVQFLSSSTASQRLDARRVLAAYGDPVDPATLAACEQLRRLHLTVWYNLYAERLPELRPRAAELLARWPPP